MNSTPIWYLLLLVAGVFLALAATVNTEFVEHWLAHDGVITDQTRSQLVLFRASLLFFGLACIILWLFRRPLSSDWNTAITRWRTVPEPLHSSELVPVVRSVGLSRTLRLLWSIWIGFCSFSLLRSDDLATLLVLEKGVFETGTVICYLFVMILAFALALPHFQRKTRGLAKWWLVVICFGSLFVALEETNWGQLYLRYRTPDLIQHVNYQGEFSFHNVELPWVLPLQVYWANEVLWSLAILGGLALPCFLLTSRQVRRWLWAWEVPVPPWISQAFFFSAALVPRDRAVLGQFQSNNMPSELREFAIAVGVAIWFLIRFVEPRKAAATGTDSIHVESGVGASSRWPRP